MVVIPIYYLKTRVILALGIRVAKKTLSLSPKPSRQIKATSKMLILIKFLDSSHSPNNTGRRDVELSLADVWVQQGNRAKKVKPYTR